MEFAQRSAPAGVPAPSRAPAPSGGSRRSNKKWMTVMKWGSVILLISVALLVIAVVALLGFSKSNEQSKYVNKDQYQAVFLNGGQVYFGKIGNLTPKYTTLNDIYYLRVNQTVQPNSNTSSNNDVSLVKLGCELHGPQDQMIINNDQIMFWENLKTDGQVTKAIATYQKQNPNGQNCSAASDTSSTSNSSSTSTDTNKKQ